MFSYPNGELLRKWGEAYVCVCVCTLVGTWAWVGSPFRGMCVSPFRKVVMVLITDRNLLSETIQGSHFVQNRWIGVYIINSTLYLWKQHLQEHLPNEKLNYKSLLPNLSALCIQLFLNCGKFSRNVKIKVQLRNFNCFVFS